MSGSEISEIIVAAVALVGALTAYLKSRTAVKTATSTKATLSAHLSNEHPLQVQQLPGDQTRGTL
jgi:hypothetical protein